MISVWASSTERISWWWRELGWRLWGQGCDARYLARVKIGVLGRDGLHMFGFDRSGGRVYGGLPIAVESG